MFVSDCLGINEIGHLTIGGLDTVALAEKYGTPLYVMDENEIRRACRSYQNSIEKFYGGKGMVAYASKALCCKALCNIAKEEGMALDVVSAGELYTAMAVEFPPARILMHGNNKTMEELQLALEYGVGTIVVDNMAELELLNHLAATRGQTASIILRIKPGVDAHTHDFVRTGSIDSKFGFALETGEAMEAIKAALGMQHLQVKGLHCHIGSQIFDIEPFELAAQVMLELMGKVREKTGHKLTMLNLGGGFGIQYIPTHDPVKYEAYMQKVSLVVKEACRELGMDMPFIVLEPGRSIVGSAGITLYQVGTIKEIPGIRTYVSVDGGMGDNPRYALYKADYDFMLANKAAAPKDTVVTVVGKCCESGDLLGEGIQIQKAATGDIMAVLATGAYNYSMASNYNRNPRPPIIMVKDGAARVAVQRESYGQLMQNDND